MNRYWVETSDISMDNDIYYIYYNVAAETAQKAVDMVRADGGNILVTRIYIETTEKWA